MLKTNDNPWLGLASYQESDAKLFFGRDEEISLLCDIIEDNYCTILYGKSGMGKTSLINAGLKPALSNQNYLPITLKLQHNSDYNYADQIIEQTLELLDTHQCSIEKVGNIDVALSDSSKLWLFFHSNIFWTSTQHRIIPVIFLDQFEEIFTICENKSDTRDFFSMLNELFQPLPPDELINILEKTGKRLRFEEETNFRLILSMREDFLARLEDYSRNIPILRKNRVGIAPMSGNQALEVILKPNPDIINRTAALKIIAHLTEMEDIVDSPEILDSLEIDTCILSLFCSQLYDTAVYNKLDEVTVELIDILGDDIIQAYYNSSIRAISKGAMNYLEENLLTKSGYRNSLAYEDVVPEHVSEEEIKQLEKSRIIRKEIQHKTERIEFTHDVLCKVAMKHKNTSITSKNVKTLTLFAGFELTFFIMIGMLTCTIQAGYNSIWNWIVILMMLGGIILRLNPIVNKQKSQWYVVWVEIISLLIGSAWMYSWKYSGLEVYMGQSLTIMLLFLYAIYTLVWGYNVWTKKRKQVSCRDMWKNILHIRQWKREVPESIMKTINIVIKMIPPYLSVYPLMDMAKGFQILWAILLIPYLICYFRPESFKNKKVLLWGGIGTALYVALFASLESPVAIPLINPISSVALLLVSYMILPHLSTDMSQNGDKAPSQMFPLLKRIAFALGLWGALVYGGLFLICGYNVTSRIIFDKGTVVTSGTVDERARKGYLIQTLEEKSIVKDRLMRPIFVGPYDHVSEVASTSDGHLLLEADGQMLSTADFLEYRNSYTSEVVDEYTEVIGNGIVAMVDELLDECKHSKSDSIKAQKMEIFCKSENARMAVDYQKCLTFARHYKFNSPFRNYDYDYLVQALQLKLATDATQKYLAEIGWENTDKEAQVILLETILYLKTGYIMPHYKDFYNGYLQENPCYLNAIKEIMVDVSVDNFKEKIINSGNFDDEISNILSSEDAFRSIYNRKFNRLIDKYLNHTVEM